MGYSLDNLSLMGLTIAVGFVVDDAIVMLENIYRHLEAGLSPVDAAVKGAQEVGFTIMSISVSLVAVFIPLLLMGGIVGRLFREFALTVTAAIGVSVLVSLTLTPMLCSRFLEHEGEHHGRIYRAIERMFEMLVNGYERGLNTARFFIGLKPHEERTATAVQIINRLRPQIAKLQGVNLFLQPAQDITVGGRISRGQFQYTVQDPDLNELNIWAPKLLAKFKTL